MTEHRHIQLPECVAPRGYSDGTLCAAGGRVLYLGGHVAFDRERVIQHPGELVPQVRLALRNLHETLVTAGGAPRHLAKMTVYTLDVAAWRSTLKEIGQAWRDVLGAVYPAMTLIGVRELFDPGAMVEIEGVAVIPATS